jgi:cytoskeletal protein CcmA (bactofilin family)
MFSKPNSSTPQPSTGPTGSTTPPAPAPQGSQQAAPTPAPAPEPTRSATPRAQKAPSIIGAELNIEGDVSGGGELQIEGTIKGDVRIEHVTVGDGGSVEGGIYAEAVEVRGKVSGSITAKQVRLYGACHVDGDITHEQLAMETGAFFQGRSLRLQRTAQAAASAPRSETREAAPASTNSAKPAGAAAS